MAKDNVTMVLKTASKIGEPNSNNLIYSKEVFEKMVEIHQELVDMHCIKLTCGQPLTAETFSSVDQRYVLGDVLDIKDGEITVSVYGNKEEELNKLLEDGFVPGMRYIAQSGSLTTSEVPEILNINLISFDMVSLKK